MRRLVSLILSIILLIACSGCFWEVDTGGDGDRDHGYHAGTDMMTQRPGRSSIKPLTNQSRWNLAERRRRDTSNIKDDRPP